MHETEAVLRGVLCWWHPTRSWVPYTPEQLTEKLIRAESQTVAARWLEAARDDT